MAFVMSSVQLTAFRVSVNSAQGALLTAGILQHSMTVQNDFFSFDTEHVRRGMDVTYVLDYSRIFLSMNESRHKKILTHYAGNTFEIRLKDFSSSFFLPLHLKLPEKDNSINYFDTVRGAWSHPLQEVLG